MKVKYLFSVLILVLFSSNLFGQDFNVEISLDNANFRSIKNLNPLKIKIINKSEKTLNTKTLLPLRFYFSKCPQTESCNTREDNLMASAKLKEKMLGKGESFEFQINLADLHWFDPMSSVWDFSEPKNIQIVPASNKHFFVDAAVIKQYVEQGSSGEFPMKAVYRSNEIIFGTKP